MFAVSDLDENQPYNGGRQLSRWSCLPIRFTDAEIVMALLAEPL